MTKRILIVDDDETSRRLLGRILRSLGNFDIEEAADGIDALEQISSEPPHLVFSDVSMPRMDGLLLCEILHRIDRWSEIPVVLESSLLGLKNIKRGLRAGAVAYVEKPLVKGAISDVVNDILEEQILLPEGLPLSVHLFLRDMVRSAKHTFNLMFGRQSRVGSVGAVPEDLPRLKWDTLGAIDAEGVAQISVQAGWTRELGEVACEALTGIPADGMDEDMLLDMLGEVLNMILGQALSRNALPGRMGLPRALAGSCLSADAEADHCFLVDLHSGQYALPLVVSIHGRS